MIIKENSNVDQGQQQQKQEQKELKQQNDQAHNEQRETQQSKRIKSKKEKGGDENEKETRIKSFNEFALSISTSVQEYLESQYKTGDHKEIIKKILTKMKTPSNKIYCRVNYLEVNSREEAILELNNYLQSNNIQFRAKPHSILFDCIVIEKNTNEESDYPLHVLDLIQPPESYKTNNYHWIYKSRSPSSSSRKSNSTFPLTHRVIICNRHCGEALLRGAHMYKPGVLSADSGIKQGEEILVYSDTSRNSNYPKGLAVNDYHGTCLFLGIGISQVDRADYFSSKHGIAVKMLYKQLPSLNDALSSTSVYFQNLSSIVVAHALLSNLQQSQEKIYILDMCCAPGGKASHVASLLHKLDQKNSLVVACDKSKKKIKTCQEFFTKSKANNITAIACDSTKLASRTYLNKSVEQILHLQGKQFDTNSFHYIVLDPPCSALGLRPKLHVDIEEAEDLTNKHPEFQKLFIKNAIALLKPGGYMTFSTCTINAMENEAMVTYILQQYEEMMLCDIPINIGHDGLQGFGLNQDQRKKVIRFDPCLDEDTQSDDTTGFFVAKFRKRP